MNIKEEFNTVMNHTVNMALATSIENKPNVRVVTFAYSSENKLYFTTFQDNKKVKEVSENPFVACMPLPENPESQSQVRIFGEAKLSDISLDEISAMIAKKYPDGASTIQKGGSMLNVYEVVFSTAYVSIGMNEPVELNF